ncbi:LysR family transcriptional regulator [Aureimonas ureilytica]|uniref:LysR family transcriptional regulator n=1 Tax=Aureimonas ureilytica TaxID=401562 RepID=UPI00035CCB34|nr:LysR family transcriptional regulator [Aureimonas ureilytica]
MAFEIRQLRHFVTVIRLASISAAARELNLTQPALSKSIRLMEQSMGVPLLERGPSGVSPTEFGTRLKTYADLVLTLSNEAVEEIDALRGVRRGALRIGCVASTLRSLMPSAITGFLERHPDMQITVSEGLNDTLLDLLHAGRLDLVVTSRPADATNPDLEYLPLMEEPLRIVASPSHPLAGVEALEIADLVPYPWVVPPRPDPDRLRLEALFAGAGLPRPRVSVETTSVVFLSGMLRGSHSLSYSTAGSVEDQASSPSSLVALRLGSPTWMRTTCAAYRRTGSLRPRVVAFVRHLAGVCAARRPG